MANPLIYSYPHTCKYVNTEIHDMKKRAKHVKEKRLEDYLEHLPHARAAHLLRTLWREEWVHINTRPYTNAKPANKVGISSFGPVPVDNLLWVEEILHPGQINIITSIGKHCGGNKVC